MDRNGPSTPAAFTFEIYTSALKAHGGLTYADVGDMLQVSTRTVQTLAKAGELPTFNVGRCVRIPLSGVQAYIRRRLEET